MMRLSGESDIPKYHTGVWSWNDKTGQLLFQSYYENVRESAQIINTAGFKFQKVMYETEELIYSQEFKRNENCFDADVIVIQDIVNLVLYLAPSEMITKKFVHFLNTKTARAFFHAIIIYFENFLKVVEFLLIRRDEISGNMPRMQSNESIKIKQNYSTRLSQYRLLLAREYSKIILGEGPMSVFHHYKRKLNISKTIADRVLHESFLAFTVQVVWIAMHRRSYDIIEMEVGRLFRSEHFSLQIHDYIGFSEAEKTVLYGKNYKRFNYRTQNSPVVQEITNVAAIDLPILWIGEHKYRGTDLRVLELELEFLVPSSQLVLINKSHGILGHPKSLYSTMLNLNWSAVRTRHFSEDYDPYNIVKQPRLQIPSVNEETLRKQTREYESYFKIIQSEEPWSKTMIQKWIKRDAIVKHFHGKGMLTNVVVKCKNLLEESKTQANFDEITQKFWERTEKLQKTRRSVSVQKE